MEQTKKIVYGTQRGLGRAIEVHKTKGWNVDRTEIKPRGGVTSKLVYVAYLTKDI